MTTAKKIETAVMDECIISSDDEEADSSDSDVPKQKRNTRKRKESPDPIYIMSESSDASDSELSPPKRKKARNVKQASEKPVKTVKSESKSLATKIKKPKPVKQETKKVKDVTKTTKTKAETTKTKKEKTETKKEKTEPKKEKTKPSSSVTKSIPCISNFAWKDYELLAEMESIAIPIALETIRLFDAGNTIPFIVRYRRHVIGEFSPEKLREIKDRYEYIGELKGKAAKVLNNMEKIGKLTPEFKHSLLCCRSLDEIEHLYSPYKQGSKSTLAQRAKKLGLEEPAISLLTGTRYIELQSFVKPDGEEGEKNLPEVEQSFIHMVAHLIATDSDVLKYIRQRRPEWRLMLEAKKSSTVDKKNIQNASKFQNYFDFSLPTCYAKSHQVLAILRGESLKCLSVKIVIPENVFGNFAFFCRGKWLRKSYRYDTRMKIFDEAIKDCFKRLISPLITRQTRSELKIRAEKESIEVFAANLKNLLLGTPLKGKPLMGIDPGFVGGCKIAVISPLGEVLDTDVIYPNASIKVEMKDQNIVKNLLLKHNCTTIVLGNGTACRETEEWLSELIKDNYFSPLDVTYTIVDECGASIYSCSDEAKKEFPDMDQLLISAVSLARRVQNPLAEFVKIEPRHLGVGMYQHDINKKKLEAALDEVVMECVSFVGVDLNTASHTLLRRVAGLTSSRADSIINHRISKGSFTNRFQLKDVVGIGEKVFEQCSGFLRVGPTDANHVAEYYERPDTNPLDTTWIHPESYDLAEKVMAKCDLNYKQLTKNYFISRFTTAISKYSPSDLAKEFDAPEMTINLIIKVLSRPLDLDLRDENRKEPLFKRGVTTFDDLTSGMILTGRVTNVTNFGAFVDIGVGRSGLIHTSEMKGHFLQLGDRVQVKIINIDPSRRRVGLSAVNKL